MNTQSGNNTFWNYTAIICYSVFTILILVFKTEIWWALLIAIFITEAAIRLFVFLGVQEGAGNLLTHPIENGLETLYTEYTETGNLRLTSTIRRVKTLYVWRWIIFSCTINLLSLPHSVGIPYLPLQDMDTFIESQTSDRDYPLMITVYTLEYLVYIVFAFIVDVILLFINSFLIALLPNLLGISILRKLKVKYPLPPPIKRKVFKILNKIETRGIASLSPKEKLVYNVHLNIYNAYLTRMQATKPEEKKE